MAAPAKTRTLILVNHPGRQARQDFEEIRAKIDALAADIDVKIVDTNQVADTIDAKVWQRPCLVVSFGALKTFRPKRGLIYCCKPIPKLEQLTKLANAEVPVPLSARFIFGRKLDQRFWGPLVVLKPTARGFMSRGAVFLMRTERTAEIAESIFPIGHPARGDVLVQQFVDTGQWPSYYRVLTFFGEPLYCRKGYAPKRRPPLDAPDAVLLKAQIASNAETDTRRKGRAANDPDVLELARRAYAAIPAVPLQGVDIIREETTGRLFVLEINPGGNTWHFSSRYIARRGSPTTRGERIGQFGAWDVAARTLIKRVREEAL
jgi:hypothetical protein